MRILQESINNLKRNRIFSLATILSISLILLIFNVLLTVNSVTKRQINQLSDKITLNIYLASGVDTETIQKMHNFVGGLDQVQNIKVIDQDAALNLVRSKYPDSVDFLEEFKLKNPLPASLQIKTKSLEDHALVLGVIQNSDFQNIIYKSKIKKEQNETITKVVENLIKIKNFTFQILLWMIVTFVISGGLIIFNAIKMTLYARRNEIQIMQFVGATFNRIMNPFIVEGLLIGASAFFISIILLTLINGIIPFTDLSLLTNLPVLILEFLISISTGTITSAYIVNKYLNTKEIFSD